MEWWLLATLLKSIGGEILKRGRERERERKIIDNDMAYIYSIYIQYIDMYMYEGKYLSYLDMFRSLAAFFQGLFVNLCFPERLLC